jgi:hypothetical protein
MSFLTAIIFAQNKTVPCRSHRALACSVISIFYNYNHFMSPLQMLLLLLQYAEGNRQQ